MRDQDAAQLAVAADNRLAHAWHLLQSPAAAVLSLDVFDTLLWRAVPEPAHAFAMLGHRLLDRRLIGDDLSPQGFAALRRAAEERARERVHAERATRECSILDVYVELALVCDRAPLARYVEAEVALEYDICRPDLGVAALATLVHHVLGKPVRLVSDTYFSSAQLWRLLARPELSELVVDHLAVSSEYGVGKTTGLFQATLMAAVIAPVTVVHVGDNGEADVVAARAAGLQAVHYAKGDDLLTRALCQEGVLGTPLGDPDVVDPITGDHGLTALRARAVRLAERDTVPERLQEYWHAGAAVLGPVFTGFATWTQERAAELGAGSIVCLLREGEFLDELLRAAQVSVAKPVPSTTMAISRQVCLLASLFTASEEELRAFLRRRRPTTVSGLFEQVGADLSQVPALADVRSARLSAPGVVDRVVQAVEDHPHLRAQIVLRGRETREHLYAHLDRHLPGEGTVLLVDIGWAGSIAKMISKLLAARGTPRVVHCLLLATQRHALEHRLDGVTVQGFLEHGTRGDALIAPLLRSPEVLEQVCLADAGSLLGFESDGSLRSATERRSRAQVAQKLAVQQGIRAFQDLWAAQRSGAPWLLDLSGAHARRLLLAAVARLVASPSVEEALAFGAWAHDDNFGATGADPLVGAEALATVRNASVWGLGQLSMDDTYWPAAAARLGNPALSAIYAATLRGEVDPLEVSARSELGDVGIFVDEGDDFAAGPTARVPALLSPQGRTQVRARLEVRGAERVRIDPPGVPALLRLDGLRLTLHTTVDEDPVVVQLHSFDEPGAGVVGGRWVGPRLMEVTSDSPMVGYDVRVEHPDLTGRIHTVDVEFAYTALGLPSGLSIPVVVVQAPAPEPPPAPLAPPTPRWRRVARRGLAVAHAAAGSTP